jgi:hypothetical protein
VSHHNSGPRAHALPSADITDLYAFPAPGQPGRLVLVLNTVPYADPLGSFSDALSYRFRIRPVTVATGQAARFAVAGDQDEIVIDCTFSPPAGPRSGQKGSCVTSAGQTVSFAVNDETGEAADGLRVFAGPRWDPFFVDAAALVETISTGRLAFKDPGKIAGDGKNVLSIVIEADCRPLLGDSSLIAVVGETFIAGQLPVRWERFGRPQLENAILGMKNYDTVNRDLEIRDLFNAEDAFGISADYAGAYRARLNANLAFWDGLDGRTDWPLATDGTHPLTELLLADFTIVDVSKPYGEDTFLEIERAAIQGRPHETSGGRSLNDDAMDTLFTFLVNAGNGPRITDGLDRPTKLASRTFPYLAPANPNPPAPPSAH